MLNSLERALRYQRVHGLRQLWRELLARVRRKLARAPHASSDLVSVADSVSGGAIDLVKRQTQICNPLRLFRLPASQQGRISVVTDSINRDVLYGGVGTALLLGVLLAQVNHRRLRIITRTEPPNPSALGAMLSTYGITLDAEVELAFAPFHSASYELDQFDDEWFVTTSWWTTGAVLGSVRPQAIWYLLQEDERMFYPHGDEHLRCTGVLSNPDIRYIVNTRFLFDHLVANGLPHLANCGQWFEPAFPARVFHTAPRQARAKRKLVFYARPHNVLSLFCLGIELLEVALARGILDLDQWDIVLIGKDISRLRFDQGRYSPEQLENLSWLDYAALAGQTDLALCLMYSPHPGNLSLDMAASGAVVVTNRFGNKQDLSAYSPNIICGEPELEAMLHALAQGLQLAVDEPARAANFRQNRLGQDWPAAFADVVQAFGARG